jgi:UDP-glucuronate 4-epimerase
LKILVTGAAGFIGMHLSIRLLKLGHDVVGLDNMNDYYDVSLKEDRIKEIYKLNLKFLFVNQDLVENISLNKLFKSFKFDFVVNLAAQAGVRYSIENPDLYLKSNVIGFFNILEVCRHYPVKHMVFASSSSVYGQSGDFPFSEESDTNKPVSFYGATKKSNEIMAHSYSSLYKMKITGLRFFTVYGPWGRPDMAPFIFTKAIKEEKKIKLFNKGEMKRDFTFIDDVVFGIEKIMFKLTEADNYLELMNRNLEQKANIFTIFNIGNSDPIDLNSFILKLEQNLEKESIKEYLPMQMGDVVNTFSDVTKIKDWIDFVPHTNIDEGLKKFVYWYNQYYG